MQVQTGCVSERPGDWQVSVVCAAGEASVSGSECPLWGGGGRVTDSGQRNRGGKSYCLCSI